MWCCRATGSVACPIWWPCGPGAPPAKTCGILNVDELDFLQIVTFFPAAFSLRLVYQPTGVSLLVLAVRVRGGGLVEEASRCRFPPPDGPWLGDEVAKDPHSM
jgi:hypothetical protein